ncbi:hypothetical protein HYDPIDRAFT_33824 [Hydnomerulius pinastri MD-312]|uniref:Uncharacterized protein n=1 Tax=Hydnomerulius pinastri MD-312 TaxID=994086 RepID=A0A0C9V0N8_9AGAM|nr:hypothetical protein HYDPIDRAFT_33824 [Hydnomerulius pinastri MD-312]
MPPDRNKSDRSQPETLRTRSGKPYGAGKVEVVIPPAKPRPKPRPKVPSPPGLSEDEQFERTFNHRVRRSRSLSLPRHWQDSHTATPPEDPPAPAPSAVQEEELPIPIMNLDEEEHTSDDQDEVEQVVGGDDNADQDDEEEQEQEDDSDEEEEEEERNDKYDDDMPPLKSDTEEGDPSDDPGDYFKQPDADDDEHPNEGGDPPNQYDESDGDEGSNYLSDARREKAKQRKALEAALTKSTKSANAQKPSKRLNPSGEAPSQRKANQSQKDPKKPTKQSNKEKVGSKGHASTTNSSTRTGETLIVRPDDDEEEEEEEEDMRLGGKGGDDDGEAIEGGKKKRRSGGLSDVARKECEEFGAEVQQKADELAKRLGKSYRTVMSAAALTMVNARGPSIWNKHQSWYFANYPIPKGGSLQEHKEKQKARYEALKSRDPDDPDWAAIEEHWEALGGGEDSSPKTSRGKVMSARDAFAKSATAWSRVKGVLIFGFVLDISGEEAAHQASGLFAGSNKIKEILNTHSVDVKNMIDWYMLVLKYGHQVGQGTVPRLRLGKAPDDDATVLMCEPGEPQRECDRRIAPIMITKKLAERGFTGTNMPWKKLMDHAFKLKFTITHWPVGVPALGANFSLHDLAADEIHDLVDAYLRRRLGPLYDAGEAAQKERVLKKGKGKAWANDDDDDEEDEEEEGIEKRQPPPEVQLVPWPEDAVKLMESDPSMKLEVPLFILEDRSYIVTVEDLTTKDKKIASAIKTLRGKKKSSQTTRSHRPPPPPPPHTHIPPASPSQSEDERPGRTSRPAGQPTHSQCPLPPPATRTHVHPASPSQSEDERTGRTARPVGRLASHPAHSQRPPPPPLPPPRTHICPASPAQSEVEDVPLHVPRNSTTGPVHPVNRPSHAHSDRPWPATTTVHESDDEPHRRRPRPVVRHRSPPRAQECHEWYPHTVEANPPPRRVDKHRRSQATHSGSEDVEQEPSKCVRSTGESSQHLERGRPGSRQHTYEDSGFYSSSTDHHRAAQPSKHHPRRPPPSYDHPIAGPSRQSRHHTIEPNEEEWGYEEQDKGGYKDRDWGRTYRR